MRRAVWLAATMHALPRRGHRPDVCHFVTLTYRGVNDWRSDHKSAATERYRRYCARIGVLCRYVWVAETQDRGAVHYHLLAWLPRGVRMPFWDRPTTSPSGRTAAAFWPHGWTNVQRARAGVGYLMKYVSKGDGQAAFPHGLRLHGAGGLDEHGKAVRAWSGLPEWAKREHGVGELRRVGGRLVMVETGEILAPMYARTFERGKLLLHQLRPMPERWHEGPYSALR